MSDSKLNPLPKDIEDLLKSAKRPAAPAGFDAAVLARIKGTLAVPSAGASETRPSSSSVAAASKLGSVGLPLSLAALVVGVGAGIVIGRTTAPEPVTLTAEARPRVLPTPVDTPNTPPAPPVVELPKTDTPSPTRPREQAKPRVENSAPVRDVALADERALIEIARTALAKRQTAQALQALQSHADKFASGQLVEERESLWVQALVNAGDKAQAEKRAEEFRRRFPQSMLLPAVDAALRSAP